MRFIIQRTEDEKRKNCVDLTLREPIDNSRPRKGAFAWIQSVNGKVSDDIITLAVVLAACQTK